MSKRVKPYNGVGMLRGKQEYVRSVPWSFMSKSSLEKNPYLWKKFSDKKNKWLNQNIFEFQKTGKFFGLAAVFKPYKIQNGKCALVGRWRRGIPGQRNEDRAEKQILPGGV